MAVLSVQDEFQSGDNVTATNLNNLVKDASFNADTTDNSTLEVHTTGYLKIKDLGVDTQHLANGAVTNAKIANNAVDTAEIAADAVTYAKMQNVSATNRVLGRDTAGAGDVEEITPSALRTMINVEDGAEVNPSNATAHDANPDSDGVNTTGGADGLMSAEDKTKLNSVEHGAEENVQSDWTASSGDAFIKNKPNIAYTSAISNATQSADGLMSSTDKTKLDGIATGATANTGTVTSVSGGTGLTGTVTTSGSLSLSNSGVSAGTYTNATVTVDATGRVTSASSGSSGSSLNVIAKGIATSSGFGGNTWQFSSMSGCTGTSIRINSTNSEFRITLNSANSGAVVSLQPSNQQLPTMSVSGSTYTFVFNNTAQGSYHFIAIG